MEKFLVSARKYRPITFESVVGQSHITSTLRNAIARGQVAHAYLFCGPRGVGKTTCARILSKTLNCLSPLDNIEPCGECESCRAFEDNRSFNIHEMDAASNNSVENIRALNEQVRIAPQIGRYSIYIIDEAHMLSTAAFNAFLKTLEEPPAHAIFILATTEKHKILPTILSRCQIYDFKRIKVEAMVKFLAHISQIESIEYDDESLHIIAQKADGCMRDALSMYDKVVSFCGATLRFKEVAEALNVLDYDSYFHFTELFSTGDYKSALLQFDQIIQKGFDSTTFLAGLSNHLRNILVAADSSTISLLEVTGSIAERFSKQAKNVSPTLIFDSLNIIAEAETALKNSLNVRLLAEITILKLCNLSPIKLSGGSHTETYTLPSISGGASQQRPTAQAMPVQQQIQQQMQPPQQEIKQEVKQEVVSEVKQESQPIAATLAESTPITKVAETKEIKEVEKTVKSEKRSLLGVSISSMIKENKKEQEKIEEQALAEDKKQVSCKENEVDMSMIIPPAKYDSVIAGCKRYAEDLKVSRPRLASSFEYCSIEDGVLKITVANNIVKDEINSSRHSITEQLIEYCRHSPLIFDIIVDEAIVETSTILIKEEDRLKFLIEKNPSLQKLCSNLKLDYL
ncbi:MAG: DNA polymerase III subunit gamma/tau [Rikenellaceae bacterium]